MSVLANTYIVLYCKLAPGVKHTVVLRQGTFCIRLLWSILPSVACNSENNKIPKR